MKYGQLSPARPDLHRNADEAAKAGWDFCPWPSPAPTDARPGSAEKVALLAARAKAGVDLWHPDDFDGENYLDSNLTHCEKLLT